MRIISGQYRGRNLKTADSPGLRPAMAKTRAALFSILESRGLIWEEAKVLDLFAGCGSLGLECLSRGAAQAVMVDNGAQAIACLRANTANLNIGAKATICKKDVASFLRSRPPEQFNLVFIDPPYRRGLAQTALNLLCDRGWLLPGAFVTAELEKGVTVTGPDGLAHETGRALGQTTLEIWKYDENSSLSGNI